MTTIYSRRRFVTRLGVLGGALLLPACARPVRPLRLTVQPYRASTLGELQTALAALDDDGLAACARRANRQVAAVTDRRVTSACA